MILARDLVEDQWSDKSKDDGNILSEELSKQVVLKAKFVRLMVAQQLAEAQHLWFKETATDNLFCRTINVHKQGIQSKLKRLLKIRIVLGECWIADSRFWHWERYEDYPKGLGPMVTTIPYVPRGWGFKPCSSKGWVCLYYVLNKQKGKKKKKRYEDSLEMCLFHDFAESLDWKNAGILCSSNE